MKSPSRYWNASSKQQQSRGNLVLDPFCGCGTTIDAAEKLGRDWISIYVTQLAIFLIKNRLQDAYGRRMKFVVGTGSTPSQTSSHQDGDAVERVPTESIVRIIGEPATPNEAATLAKSDLVKPSQTKSSP